jgi:serine/threonine protein kinase
LPIEQHASSATPDTRPSLKAHRSTGSDRAISVDAKGEWRTIQVVARVSIHALRLQREFQLAKLLTSRSDPDCIHFVRPIELVQLPRNRGQDPFVVSVFEAPGLNYLREVITFGPNAYRGVSNDESWTFASIDTDNDNRISLRSFLDFAIGATECCEILHHGNRMVHGEIRGDAFHFNQVTGKVRMINFGSGARSFENGLTSAGWSSLIREIGVEHKLQFIAPEQTGRLPAEPDLRTDIYSLGILFWMILTGERPFEGKGALEVMQSVLSRRLSKVASKRLDVPHVLCMVIQKMTQRNMDDRYHSTTGVKYDLIEISRMLTEGDTEGLRAFKIAQKDVSSFFVLPSRQIGREKEQRIILDIMTKVSRRYWQPSHLTTLSSNSSYSDTRHDTHQIEDTISETTSSRGSESRLGSGNDTRSTDVGREKSRSNDIAELPSLNRLGTHTSGSHVGMMDVRPSSGTNDSSMHRSNSIHSSHDSPSLLLRKGQRFRRKGRCEVVVISGATGLGKSCLVQSIQLTARKYGYFASAKFDQARKAPYDPVLRLLSSLFRQIFSESEVTTDFHNTVRNFVRPVWPTLHGWLDLPQWLLNSGTSFQNGQSRNVQFPMSRRPSSPALQCGSAGNTAADWLKSGGSTKSSKFINTFLDVLRLLASEQFICCCIDDLQFADDESLELIQCIVAGKIPMLLILTFREEEMLSGKVRSIIANATSIKLKPFTEEQTADFVSETLHRDRDYVLPLVAVVQEKTRGNPFLLREMLQTCWRKQCVYYSWKNSVWEYDLDKIFSEFESQAYGEQISTDFIIKRLRELPSVARCLLTWASLIGNSFSFNLLKRLMTSEIKALQTKRIPLLNGTEDPVAGLQSALSAFIIVIGEDEDRFRFAHDR